MQITVMCFYTAIDSVDKKVKELARLMRLMASLTALPVKTCTVRLFRNNPFSAPPALHYSLCGAKFAVLVSGQHTR